MTQTAQPNIGSQITISIGTQGASPTYTVINGITKATPPQQKFGTYDKTALTTGFKKAGKTIPDYGELSIEGYYESADPGQAALAAAFAVLDNSTYGGDFPFEVQLPPLLSGGQTTTGDLIKFNGPVTEFQSFQSVEADRALMFKATIKVNSAPVVTLGS